MAVDTASVAGIDSGFDVIGLSAHEQAVLIRVLYVVKDNFWLDEAEESLLERLLEAA
jgi:hypothetical protein